MRKLKPTCCTSMNCSPPQDHCRACSHAIFAATLTAGGRRYRMEFNPYHGPDFGKAGEKKVSGWCPNRKHPVWPAFGMWFARKFAKGQT